jgi:BlaI family transcriptional regulator, penicillinase repressor
MPPRQLADSLSRREKQIMDILFRRGEATVTDVRAELPNPPSYSAVRAQLRILEEKGHVTHREDGPRFVYTPTVRRSDERLRALDHLVTTFFDGSREALVNALIAEGDTRLDEEELRRLASLVAKARRDGR